LLSWNLWKRSCRSITLNCSLLRLAGKRLGLLINFNVPVLAKGIKRIVNF
jgi:hypothetical protein